MRFLDRLPLRAPRLAELVLGVVFLAGAFLKSLDVNLFTVQIRAYRVFDHPTALALAALATLALETAIGAALILRLRRWTYLALAAFLSAFTGLIAYAWAFHGLAECGCFGPIEMSPGISIGKNVVLLGLTVVAWHGFRKKGAGALPQEGRAMVRAWACAGLAAATVLYAYLDLDPAVRPTEQNRPFAQFRFETDGVPFDLGVGEHFVVMLNTTCEHCMAAVESLNTLALVPDFPAIVGICFEEEPGSLDTFRDDTAPLFPLHSLGDSIRTFFSLVGEAPPRFIYVRDGTQIVFWDEQPPDPGVVFLARKVAERAEREVAHSWRRPAGAQPE